ncbi:MAG: hypothetical protein ACP5E5_13335 [Acidobacteriaceae bacterium]
MRRFTGLAALLFLSLPLGLTVTGCAHHAAPVVYCFAGDSGPVVGQAYYIELEANTLATTGESLNYAQMGVALSAQAYDCKRNSVSVSHFTYGSTSSFENNVNGGPIFADINPSTGQVCGGTWNRFTGGGVADYTVCNPPSPLPTQHVAQVTAEADGVTSNAIDVYVHPVITGVVLGPASKSCAAGSDVGSDCCPNDTVGTPVATPAGVVDGSKCVSQNQTGQLVARVYDNGGTTGNAADNITCQVGHLTFNAQTPGVVSIDENGAATAQMPGSTVITATVANSSTATNAGIFATCPPASISLQNPNNPSANSISVPLLTEQPLNTTVLDTNGNVITGLTLEFNSTNPQVVLPAAGGSVTPQFPGSVNVTAVCQPSSCNPAPFSQLGLYGTGKAVTSNPITVNVPGTSSTVVYMGSTSSQYVAFKDFTTNETSTLIYLPWVPNSMVMNLAGTEIYLGSQEGLMTIATRSNTVSGYNQDIQGSVLSVSPDGNTLVVTDPALQTISLVNTATGSIKTSYTGVGTSATWSIDNQAVYITTTTNQVLTYSTYTDWQVATAGEVYTASTITVPGIGAFFAGPQTTDARTYCPSSVVSNTSLPPTVANSFIPLVAQNPVTTDQIISTDNGQHIVGAHANGTSSNLTDIDVSLPLPTTSPTPGVNYGCPIPPAAQPAVGYFGTTVNGPIALPGIDAATITGLQASTNSQAVFVNYTMPTGATTGGGLLPLYVPQATGIGTLQTLTLGNGATVASAPESGVFSTDNFTYYVGTGSSDGASLDNDVHEIKLVYPTSGPPTATEAPGGIITPELPLANGSGYAPVNLIAQYPKLPTS